MAGISNNKVTLEQRDRGQEKISLDSSITNLRFFTQNDSTLTVNH